MFEGYFLSTPYRIDRKLYKYFSLKNIDYAIDSIKERRIHLDDPNGFNDPFDAAFSLRFYTITKTGDSAVKEWQKILYYMSSDPQIQKSSLIPECVKCIASIDLQALCFQANMPATDFVNRIYDLIHDKTGISLQDMSDSIDRGFAVTECLRRFPCKISCLSEVYDSILMWSYYAENHKGICVEYNLSKLDSETELNKQIIRNISKVHYSSIRADNLVRVDRKNNRMGVLNFLLTKSDVWSHEHEWRVVCDTKEEYLPFDCISGIYLGVNFDNNSDTIAKLVDAASTYPDLPIYQCKLNPDRYQIDIEDAYHILYQIYKRKNELC